MKQVWRITARSVTKKLEEELKAAELWIKPDNLGTFTIVGWPEYKVEEFISMLNVENLLFRKDGPYKQWEKSDFLEYSVASARTIMSDGLVSVVPDILRNNPSFDYSRTCKNCGSGIEQIAPLVLDWRRKKEVKNEIITPIGIDTWIVGDSVKSILDGAKITGLNYMPVLSSTDGEKIEGLWQIRPSNYLPKGLIQNCYMRIGKYKDCDCESGVVGLSEVGRLLEFQKNSIVGMSDFNETSERFSLTGGAIILSQKLALLFFDMKIKNLALFPVQVI